MRLPIGDNELGVVTIYKSLDYKEVRFIRISSSTMYEYYRAKYGPEITYKEFKEIYLKEKGWYPTDYDVVTRRKKMKKRHRPIEDDDLGYVTKTWYGGRDQKYIKIQFNSLHRLSLENQIYVIKYFSPIISYKEFGEIYSEDNGWIKPHPYDHRFRVKN